MSEVVHRLDLVDPFSANSPYCGFSKGTSFDGLSNCFEIDQSEDGNGDTGSKFEIPKNFDEIVDPEDLAITNGTVVKGLKMLMMEDHIDHDNEMATDGNCNDDCKESNAGSDDAIGIAKINKDFDEYYNAARSRTELIPDPELIALQCDSMNDLNQLDDRFSVFTKPKELILMPDFDTCGPARKKTSLPANVMFRLGSSSGTSDSVFTALNADKMYNYMLNGYNNNIGNFARDNISSTERTAISSGSDLDANDDVFIVSEHRLSSADGQVAGGSAGDVDALVAMTERQSLRRSVASEGTFAFPSNKRPLTPSHQALSQPQQLFGSASKASLRRSNLGQHGRGHRFFSTIADFTIAEEDDSVSPVRQPGDSGTGGSNRRSSVSPSKLPLAATVSLPETCETGNSGISPEKVVGPENKPVVPAPVQQGYSQSGKPLWDSDADGMKKQSFGLTNNGISQLPNEQSLIISEPVVVRMRKKPAIVLHNSGKDFPDPNVSSSDESRIAINLRRFNSVSANGGGDDRAAAERRKRLRKHKVMSLCIENKQDFYQIAFGDDQTRQQSDEDGAANSVPQDDSQLFGFGMLASDYGPLVVGDGDTNISGARSAIESRACGGLSFSDECYGHRSVVTSLSPKTSPVAYKRSCGDGDSGIQSDQDWDRERLEDSGIGGYFDDDWGISSEADSPAAEEDLSPAVKRQIKQLLEENMHLRTKLDNRTQQIDKLRTKENVERMKAVLPFESAAMLEPDFESSGNSNSDDIMRALESRIHEHDYLGLIECDKQDAARMMDVLVKDMKPTVAKILDPPCLPSFLFFMCMRYCDHVNDEQRLMDIYYKALMAVQSSAKLLQKRESDLDSCAMFLSMCLKLMQLMRQYSGQEEYKAQNTVRQNEQCVHNFGLQSLIEDIGNYVGVLYKQLLNTVEKIVQRLIVPAILEHEEVSGFGVRAPRSQQRRFSLFASPTPLASLNALPSLLEQLNHLFQVLATQAVDWPVLEQVFAQVFHWISVHAVNNIVVRKDCCSWSKGMQIKFNLNAVEEWSRDHNLGDLVLRNLQPLREISNLLIVNKCKNSDQTVGSVCESVAHLKTVQVIKILNMYSGDIVEEKIPQAIIAQVAERLKAERGEAESAGDSPLVSLQCFPLEIPFVASQTPLETIEIPDNLNLRYLKRL